MRKLNLLLIVLTVILTVNVNAQADSLTNSYNKPNELLIVDYIVHDVNCVDPTGGTITLIAVGGTLPYSYSWSNGKIMPFISNLTAGNYSATVTDANGYTVESGQITVNAAIGIVAIIHPASVTHVSYYGITSGSSTVITVGGSYPFSYVWNGPGNNQTTAAATGLQAGLHEVTVTDANGCSTVASITIIQSEEYSDLFKMVATILISLFIGLCCIIIIVVTKRRVWKKYEK